MGVSSVFSVQRALREVGSKMDLIDEMNEQHKKFESTKSMLGNRLPVKSMSFNA